MKLGGKFYGEFYFVMARRVLPEFFDNGRGSTWRAGHCLARDLELCLTRE